MANTVGKISGQVLEANLLREGEDLAFETDLIYLNVNTRRVGINNDTPFRTLLVDQAIKTSGLIVDDQLTVGDLTLSGNTVASSSNIYFSAFGDSPQITAKRLETSQLFFDGNVVGTKNPNQDINFVPAGSGKVLFKSNVLVNGSVHATGDVTFDGSIIIGNDNTDNVLLSAEIGSDIIPDITDTYSLGSASKQWNTLSTILINGESISSSGAVVGGVDISTRAGNIWYVSANGNDSNVGDHPNGPFSTIEWALGQASSGDTVYIYPGTYVELFPLVVPQGVTVTGAGIRSVKIVPDTASQYEDVFKLNGETTIEDLTITDFYYDSGLDKGYAFSFAPGFTVTSRSPYIRNVSVLTRGSTSQAFIDGEYADAIASTFLDGGAATGSVSQIINGGAALFVTSNDPLGFGAGDAGRGAFIDGSVANAGSNQASMLFQSCTFVTPGVDCVVMKNGVRVEWLSCFTYYANRGLYAENGTAGFAGLGLKFGAEIRSIGSANIYGNYGAWADGDQTLMYLISHNFGFIGSGKNNNNDPSDAISANEITKLNDGKIYYQSTDQGGNLKIGDLITVEQETGRISINTVALTTNNLRVSDGPNTSYIDALTVDTGNIKISGNSIVSLSGSLNFSAVSNNIDLTSNVTIGQSVSATGNVTLKKNFTIGNSDTDTAQVNARINSTLIPSVVERNFGSTSNKWRNLYASKLNFEDILIDTNVITTTLSNSNLELGANGTGIVRISDNFLASQNVTISGSSTFNNVTSTGTLITSSSSSLVANSITAPDFFNGDIVVNDNYIATTQSNSNLELRANSTGGLLVDGVLKFTDSTISNSLISGTEADRSIELTSYAGTSVKLNSSTALTIPVGNNTNRILTNTGEIRFNNLSNLYQARISGATKSLYGLYDTDLNTNITAELTPGANDNIIRMTINGTVQGTITSNAATFEKVRVDEIEIDSNRFSTVNSNANIELSTSGTGLVNIKDSLTITNSIIKNITPNAVTTLASSSTGYIKFADNTALRIPYGTSSQEPTGVPVGAIRFNTDAGQGEIFNGIDFISMAGTSSGVTAVDMEEITNTWILILA